MAFLISPGVQVNEIDLTNVIPALASSTAGYAGHFTWGPIGQLVTVSSEKDLITNFGPPDTSTAKSFLTAASFLKYGNNLKISRAVSSDAKNATGAVNAGTVSADDKLFIGNLDEYESLANPLTSAAITARYPGSAGNSIRVIIARPDDTTWGGNSLIQQNFSSIPSSTAYAEAYAQNIGVESILDEIHVLVIDDKGVITGTPGSVLERYEGLSLASDAKTETGATNYYKNVINRSSNYIYITSLSAVNVTEWSQADKPISQVFESTQTETIVASVDGFGNQLFDSESFPYNILDENEELIPHIISDLVAASGSILTVAVTVTDDLGAPITVPIEESISAVVTVTVTEDDEPNPNFNQTYNIIISPNVNTDINIDDYNIQIEIGDLIDNIVVSYPIYENVITAGYGNPTSAGLQDISCSGAVVGSVINAGSVTSALEYFSDSETVDVNFIFSETYVQGSNVYSGSVQNAIDNTIATIVNSRKDCVGFISAPLDMSTQFSDTTKKQYLIDKADNINGSSYLIMDSTPVYVYNKYTDSYVWISACGHMAGLCANADRVADAWFSPAGLNRGGLLGVTKLAYNADQASRDDIYKLGVNPIVSFPGQGIILYGDKTLQRKPSAFDRINVRRLFITLEKAIATAAKFQLFEQNDDFTRSSFRNSIEPFLRDIQGRRGITDFRVVCDATNNTGEIIDGNRFVADIYIKPTRSINYITLNFIATRTGVEFKEIVG